MNPSSASQGLDRKTVFLFSIICAVTVANIYFSQPLLGEFTRAFHIDEATAGWVTTLAQLGYAIGVFAIVPLGDVFERRHLLLVLTTLLTLFLFTVAISPNFLCLSIFYWLVGVVTVVPQILIPYAAALSPAHKRAATIGTIQAGLLIGILLARTFAGAIAEAIHWRAVYFVAAGITLVIGLVIAKTLRPQAPQTRLAYPQLLKSMIELLVQQPRLRWVSISGAFNFAVFSVFWTTLTFLIERNFGYGPGVVGLFGIVGVVGALSATFTGRLSDRFGTHRMQYISEVTTLVSFFILAMAAHSLPLLIIGIIVLDAGAQAQHISCQADVIGINPEARSRLNGMYMFIRFLGGALGSTTGAYAWKVGEWKGVVMLPIGYSVLSLLATTRVPAH